MANGPTTTHRLALRFTVRDMFALVAKAACLLPALVFMIPKPVEIAVTLAIFLALLAVELAVSSVSSGPMPRLFAIIFFIARLAFAYAVCLSVELIVLFVVGIRELQAAPGVRLTMVFALAIMGWWTFLASLASLIAASITWRKDRRARWLVFLNAPVVLGVMIFALVLGA